MSICGVEVGEKGMDKGADWLEGEQAEIKTSSAKNIIVRFVA